jgi:hypothetical protein
LVINHPLPAPSDWGSKPEHLNGAKKVKAYGAKDAHISHAVGIFSECDGGLALEAQQALPRLAGLPEPSLANWTGSKSLHMYWLLEPGEVLDPATFRELQKRLAARLAEVAPDAKPDNCIHNPARLMRAPGGYHPATGKPCTIQSDTGERFTVAQLLELLPEPPKTVEQRSTAPAHGDAVPLVELLPRNLNQLAAQGAPEGSRNSDAFTIAASAVAIADAAAAAGLRVDGTPEDLVLEFAARCSPPMDQREALGRLQSAESQSRTTDPGWPDRLRFQLNQQHRQKQQQPKSKRVPGPKGGDAAPGNEPPASWGDLIGQLPDGWVVTERGTFPSKLSAGHLARMLERKQDLFRYNELTMFCEVHTRPGWCAVVDAELDSAYVLLSQKGWIIGAEPITKAVCHVARLRSFHPVKQYLLGLEQKPSVEDYNLDEVAPRFFRANDPLHVAMVRKWLIGAVARAMNPGCQMDYCLVLQSRQQGLMKSTSFRDLASPDWFTSTVPDADKDFLLNVHSCWIFELAELESVTGKRDAGRLKNLITTSVDTFRVPYGRTAERRLRGSVFCGTVNEDSFLKDPTGNRRYWVVPIEGSEPLDREGLKAARDGIWKAAMAAWRAGELPMLTRAQEALSEIQNETFVQSDPWLAMLDLAITETPRQWQKPFSTAQALMAAKLKNGEQISRADETRIAPLLRRLGFEKAKNPATTDDGKRVRLWSAAQPAQPCTTSNGGGCAPPEPLQQNGSQRAAQPAQPIHSERLKRGEVEPAAVGDQWGELPYVGETVVQVVHPPLEPLAQQGFDPAQPLDLGVVQVVQGCAPATPPSWPTWGDALLQLRAHHPDHLPAQLANLLHAQRGIHTDGRAVKAALKAWDAMEAA